MIGVIYLTKNLVNQKIYIGSDTKNKGNGDPDYLGSGVLLNRAIEKYGRENFSKEILQRCPTLEVLKQKEGFFIKKFKSNQRDIGYNISDGYWGGDTLSNHPDAELIREKITEQSNKNAKRASESRKQFYKKETEEEKEARIKKITQSMKNWDKSFFEDPQYIKNLSDGIKNSDSFKEYNKRRTGKKRGKYKVDQKGILERRQESISQLKTEKFKSLLSDLLGKDNSTFSANLKVYLHLDGISIIPQLDEFIAYLESIIYSEKLSPKEAKEKFDSLGLNKEGIGKSTVVLRALYDFELYGAWPQRIIGPSKKF
jgi:group I intron endonuclease